MELERPQLGIESGATLIHAAFLALLEEFDAITRRSRLRFETRDWHGYESDNIERLDLYPQVIGRTIAVLGELLGHRRLDEETWGRIRDRFAEIADEGPNPQIARTFFNSITRRVFDIDGVNPRIEFTSIDTPLEDRAPSGELFVTYEFSYDPDDSIDSNDFNDSTAPNDLNAPSAPTDFNVPPDLGDLNDLNDPSAPIDPINPTDLNALTDFNVPPDLGDLNDPKAPNDLKVPRALIDPHGPAELTALVRRILGDFRFDSPWVDVDRDAREVAQRIRKHLTSQTGEPHVTRIEIVRSIFYRVKHAYLVGRLVHGKAASPFILPLLHDERGVFVDAVLLEEDEASILFSFTRAYFSVVSPEPDELVLFLRSILPRKPSAELYLSIGFHKHGKTEVYRRLARHLDRTTDQFVIADGERGMVMLVFALPSFDLVFKLIRDRFGYPKTMTADQVRQRYRMVFERDRVGRLVEAQSFEHLRFPKSRFSTELLEELRTETAHSVRIDEDFVRIDFLYTERRVRPLNLFLREVEEARARRAVIDYGNAIKELAAANIFPGDFLIKNFGVTRHGRVVFYDYDELCPLTDCNFREFPVPRTIEDELSAEPWYAVGPNDIFPEEFPRFLGIPPHLMDAFTQHHQDLLTPKFWRGLQERLRAGEIPDVYPYPQRRRLRGPGMASARGTLR